MKKTYFFLSFLLLILEEFSLLPDEKREELFTKYIKEVTTDFPDISFDDIDLNLNLTKINYDFDTIQNVLDNYGFKYSYNFFEEITDAKYVLSQKRCGSCWAFASTTALSYRYHKIGKKIKLSPQYPLSCLSMSCEKGVYRTDSQMFLVKTGSVTLDCFPYSSQNRTVENCPEKCNDGSNLNFYRAKNLYTLENYSQENYYDIVALIIDQLINNGPVAASITVYQDFQDLSNFCSYIYSYDGISELRGAHMVVIVGYGYDFDLKKYYWIVQNSWGEDFCDKGIVNIEFGEIGIEHVSFVTPIIDKPITEKKEVNVKLESLNINDKCEFIVSGPTENWEDTLEITYEHEASSDNTIVFQCGVNKVVKNEKIINCYYGRFNGFKKEGNYKFKNSESLGNENTFTLTGFNEKTFYFIGQQILTPFINLENSVESVYFVSQKGSSIIFSLENMKENLKNIPKIYINNNKLSKCKTDDENSLVKCELESKEVKYFSEKKGSMMNSYFCGNNKNKTNVNVYKLDLDKYPVFKVKKFKNCSTIDEQKQIKCLIDAEVKGKLPENKENKLNSFTAKIKIEFEDKTFDKYFLMNCPDLNPKEINVIYTFECIIKLEYKDEPPNVYKDIYLLPYYGINKLDYPFEVIISRKFKNNYCFCLKFNLISILLIILLI